MTRYWSPAEVETLRGAVLAETSLGGVSWEGVAGAVGSKTAKQCSVRFHNIEKFGDRPNGRMQWSPLQDHLLLHIAMANGNAWAAVAGQLGVGVSVAKNRYYVLRRMARRDQPVLVLE
ncbi:Myb-like DNA-binding domain-containing protein [Spironucleus salmonicida]|uniref:Myb-like DNA-binding domain-containing protein n=1 Tax=Spironucleus salmonicida TaxID=348837 RepID=V6LG12_9EUKA|nr:Myb-like DNA-binding domain-containing protein [Spironucleus salmonicida]|eukprot:EST43495.1 Myb-like DNA-binding domain-containing protein [Spironucleus salmonicida]